MNEGLLSEGTGREHSHRKSLSNHLINKFGAICKVATEGASNS